MTPDRLSFKWRLFAWPLRLAAFIFWVVYLLFFSLYLASGEWVMVAALAGLLGAVCLVMLDLRLVAILGYAGSPTFFVFANNLLDALPFATVERAIFFGLSIMALLSLAFRKRAAVNLDHLEKMMLLFLAIVLVSMLRNFMLGQGVLIKQDIAFYIQGYFMPILSYWLMRRIDWTEIWVTRYLWAMVLGSVVLAIQGIAQTYLGLGFFMPTWIEVINEGRATGSFSNATEYGIACLIPMLFALLLQSCGNGPARWLFLLLLAGAALVGLILCKTRAPWLAALLAFGVVFVYDRRQRPLLAFAGSFGIIGGIAALPFVIDSDLFQRRILDPEPIYARIALFSSGVRMLADYPILGIGFGKDSFETVKVDYLTSVFGISYDSGARTGPPHNEWLGVMTMTGVFGFMTFIAMYVLCWRKLREVHKDISRPPLQRLMAVYVFAIFLSQIVVTFFVDIGYMLYTTSATFGAIGIVAARWRTSDAAHVPTAPVLRLTSPIGSPERFA